MNARTPIVSLAKPGHNCWRVEPADRVAFIVDGEAYYRALAESFARAERSIAIVGWDVNSRVRLIQDGEDSKLPAELGPLLDALAARRRGLRVWVLEWDFPMLYALDRQLLPIVQFGWRTHRRVHFRLGSSHPIGASHHQKIVTIDDKVAFVGGMDVTHGRWDTSAHHPDDPRRRDPWGRRYPPYHDVQLVCDGRAAAALAAITRACWRREGGRQRRPVRTAGDPWPESVAVEVERVDVAIARTEPGYASRPAVTEVANAWLDMIRAARRSIYIENQYLTCAAIGALLEERLAEPECPEVVIVITHSSSGWLEEATMGILRARLLERLRAADRCQRLHVYYVCAGKDLDVKIHAKLAIVDDQLLRIGSANLNNRSMGLDSECDVFLEAGGRRDVRAAILAFRDRLLAEHLGAEPDQVHAEIESRGSIAAAIEALRGGEHTLVPLDADRDSWIDSVIPDSALIDPERPVGLNDLIEQLAPSDLDSLRGPLERLAILAAAAAGVAALWFATPLPARHATFGIDAWLAPVRNSPVAPLIAVAAVALGSTAIAPVTLLCVLCGLVFGPWIGSLGGFCGAMLGAALGYAIGARVRRGTIERVVGLRSEAISRQFRIGGLRAVWVARLLPLGPFGAVNLVAGAVRVELAAFLLGTACVMAPGGLVLAGIGHAAAQAIGSARLAGATAIALAISAALLTIRRHLRAPGDAGRTAA
jgi:phospholipase D1/2